MGGWSGGSELLWYRGAIAGEAGRVAQAPQGEGAGRAARAVIRDGARDAVVFFVSFRRCFLFGVARFGVVVPSVFLPLVKESNYAVARNNSSL